MCGAGCFAARRWSSARRRNACLRRTKKKGPLFEIMEAQVIRLSLVDDGAYPQSAIRLRVDPLAAEMPNVQRLSPRS